MVLIVGVPLNVPPVSVNISFSELIAVVPVPVVGIRYGVLYSPAITVDNAIPVHPENIAA